jgi:ribonucleoside-diphosphate reductase alpha chain
MVEGHENIKMSNSIIDYVFRALGLEYLNRTDIVQVPPKEVKEAVVTEDVQVIQKAEPVTPVQKTEPVTPVQKTDNEQTTQTATNSVDTVQEVLSDMMGDAPACDDCGHITVRNGSCYKCLNCGNSLGCS